jgi:hypothetical protein
VVKIHASYSGGPGFESRTRRPAILLEVFGGFPQSLLANSGIVLKLGHDLFLTNYFPFIIIHLPSYHRRYIVLLLKKRLKLNYKQKGIIETLLSRLRFTLGTSSIRKSRRPADLLPLHTCAVLLCGKQGMCAFVAEVCVFARQGENHARQTISRGYLT